MRQLESHTPHLSCSDWERAGIIHFSPSRILRGKIARNIHQILTILLIEALNLCGRFRLLSPSVALGRREHVSIQWKTPADGCCSNFVGDRGSSAAFDRPDAREFSGQA